MHSLGLKNLKERVYTLIVLAAISYKISPEYIEIEPFQKIFILFFSKGTLAGDGFLKTINHDVNVPNDKRKQHLISSCYLLVIWPYQYY